MCSIAVNCFYIVSLTKYYLYFLVYMLVSSLLVTEKQGPSRRVTEKMDICEQLGISNRAGHKLSCKLFS